MNALLLIITLLMRLLSLFHVGSAFVPSYPYHDNSSVGSSSRSKLLFQPKPDDHNRNKNNNNPRSLKLDKRSSTQLDLLQETLEFANSISKDDAEVLAGPFFGGSLFPYIAFIYFLNVEENDTPKGVTVGFASCLSFVFLTIPAAIAAKIMFDVSLADSDWLHGSAESLLTITNLLTVVAFRQALNVKSKDVDAPLPSSATSYAPMTLLLVILTLLAGVTAVVPALADPNVHTPYLGAFMDLPKEMVTWGNPEPDNALTVATWIIHWSSLVEL